MYLSLLPHVFPLLSSNVGYYMPRPIATCFHCYQVMQDIMYLSLLPHVFPLLSSNAGYYMPRPIATCVSIVIK